ncbi:hypothetical protein N7G274_009176 [Stereocaulon virgatum]|uniref:Uncharacterized protein n=1 Tax=Stereocaulon virgatum TaxID=373712 RepID=A0ABR4A4F2_9LECA
MPRNRKSRINHQSRKDRSAQDDDTNMCDIRGSVDQRGVPPEVRTSSPVNSRFDHIKRSFPTQPSQRSQQTHHRYHSAQTFEPAFRLNHGHPNNLRYVQVICDIFRQGSALQQNMKKLLEGLEKLLPDEDEMEWESVGTTIYMPWQVAGDVSRSPGDTRWRSESTSVKERVFGPEEEDQIDPRCFEADNPGSKGLRATLTRAADKRLSNEMDSS